MATANLGPDYDLGQRLSSLEKQVASLQTRDWLQNASIGAGGLVVNGGGSINVEGTGAVYVDGLKLSALSPGSVGGSASNFPVTTTSTVVYSATVTVPPGYTTALVMSVCQADIWNPTSQSIIAYSSTGIAGPNGAESDATVGPSTAATLTPAAIQSVAVSGMASFPISVSVRASTALPASSSNVGTVNAIIMFVA